MPTKPRLSVYVFGGGRHHVEFRVVCDDCGQSWSVLELREVERLTWPDIVKVAADRRGCTHERVGAPDRIGPDDEAWLREALK